MPKILIKFLPRGREPNPSIKRYKLCHETTRISGDCGEFGFRKSTLLHTLGGLDQPSSGEVFIKGQSLQKASESELARLRNQNLGLCINFTI